MWGATLIFMFSCSRLTGWIQDQGHADGGEAHRSQRLQQEVDHEHTETGSPAVAPLTNASKCLTEWIRLVLLSLFFFLHVNQWRTHKCSPFPLWGCLAGDPVLYMSSSPPPPSSSFVHLGSRTESGSVSHERNHRRLVSESASRSYRRRGHAGAAAAALSNGPFHSEAHSERPGWTCRALIRPFTLPLFLYSSPLGRSHSCRHKHIYTQALCRRVLHLVWVDTGYYVISIPVLVFFVVFVVMDYNKIW